MALTLRLPYCLERKLEIAREDVDTLFLVLRSAHPEFLTILHDFRQHSTS